jgi:prepilin-type N-terminal cleavage/methylation domain-containing protein/prepilin-type processing-associated H-X9-DG protein
LLTFVRRGKIDFLKVPIAWRFEQGRVWMKTSRSGGTRRGFTLIELLVVIAIIGVLVALLLPAVQKVRETANRAKCLNNLKQLSLAMLNYHSDMRTLPDGGSTYHGSGTWQVLILPYIEQNTLRALYQGYDQLPINGAWISPNLGNVTSKQLPICTCPSDMVALPGGQTWAGTSYHNYAANFGNTAVGDSYSDGTMRTENTYNGITFAGAPFGYRNPQRFSDITDGASTTLMLAEVVQGQRIDLRGFTWWGDGAAFMTSLRPNDSNPDIVTHLDYCDPNPPNPPADCTGISTADGHAIRVFAARSRHLGGLNVSFCDGSCRWISNDVDPLTWQALGTSRGNETLGNY